MRRGVSDVEEEGFLASSKLLDHLGGAIVEPVGVVEALGDGADRRFVVDEGERIEEVDNSPDGAEVLVEASVDRIGLDAREGAEIEEVADPESVHGRIGRQGEVPFTDHPGSVAGGAEYLRNGGRMGRKFPSIAGLAGVVRHPPDARLVRIESGHERGASWAAARGVREVGETDAVLCEAVEVGGLNLPAVAAEVGVAEIVGHDDDDIRTFRGNDRESDKEERG